MNSKLLKKYLKSQIKQYENLLENPVKHIGWTDEGVREQDLAFTSGVIRAYEDVLERIEK